MQAQYLLQREQEMQPKLAHLLAGAEITFSLCIGHVFVTLTYVSHVKKAQVAYRT